MDTLADDLEIVQQIALDAAQMALERADDVTAREKQNLSYVTDLDNDVERMIRARLAEAFPSDRLTGEELDSSGGTGPRRWSIDPIDGTGNLVHRLPIWAISIGLIDAGEPVLGVIAVPPLGELYWATKGGGAWRDGEPLEVLDAEAFHNQDNVHVGTNALRVVDPRTIPGRLRDLGSACAELAFLAAGRLQACTFLGEAIHDVAAGALIAAEAGCDFGRLDGKPLSLAEFVAQTPVQVPTFIAPPKRLRWLMDHARAL
ncbi:MAG TPA: inositol monophosphatase family protein [Isosphaeraceae bacterium]|nr:inositol monophosphatase family protein [Isosphaeraceae bacterium]